MADQRKRSKEERRRYIERRAERTAAGASRGGARWSISDARVALDPTLSVPEAALRVGRTATAVEVLRKKWRLGQLGATLAAQVPPPPKRPTAEKDGEQ